MEDMNLVDTFLMIDYQGYCYQGHEVSPNEEDCGYTVFNTTREKAYELLEVHVNEKNIQISLKGILKKVLLQQEFMDYLKQTGNLLENATEAIVEQNIENSSEDLNTAVVYIQFDVKPGHVVDAGWAHLLVLFALAHIQNIHLHLWELNEHSGMIPHRHNPEYHRQAAKGKPVDLLFVDGNRFVQLKKLAEEKVLPDDLTSEERQNIVFLFTTRLPVPEERRLTVEIVVALRNYIGFDRKLMTNKQRIVQNRVQILTRVVEAIRSDSNTESERNLELTVKSICLREGGYSISFESSMYNSKFYKDIFVKPYFLNKFIPNNANGKPFTLQVIENFRGYIGDKKDQLFYRKRGDAQRLLEERIAALCQIIDAIENEISSDSESKLKRVISELYQQEREKPTASVRSNFLKILRACTELSENLLSQVVTPPSSVETLATTELSQLSERERELNQLQITDGKNALHLAILAGDANQVKAMLANRLSANIPTAKRRSPLSLAILDDKNELKNNFTKSTSAIAIVELLLMNNADPNESLVQVENRSFIHIFIFERVGSSIKVSYLLRRDPNIELVKLFLLHGSRLDVGSSEVIAGFTALLNDKTNCSSLAKLLHTSHSYSIDNLAGLYETEHELKAAYQTLTARNNTSISAQSELPVIKQYVERYCCVLEFFLRPDTETNPHVRHTNRSHCAEKIGHIRSGTREEDFKLLTRIMDRMKEKIKNINDPRSTNQIQFESSEEEVKTYQAVYKIAVCLLKCIERIDNMYTIRYQPDEQAWAITSFENELLDKRLPKAKAKAKFVTGNINHAHFNGPQSFLPPPRAPEVMNVNNDNNAVSTNTAAISSTQTSFL